MSLATSASSSVTSTKSLVWNDCRAKKRRPDAGPLRVLRLAHEMFGGTTTAEETSMLDVRCSFPGEFVITRVSTRCERRSTTRSTRCNWCNYRHSVVIYFQNVRKMTLGLGPWRRKVTGNEPDGKALLRHPRSIKKPISYQQHTMKKTTKKTQAIQMTRREFVGRT